MPRLAAIEALRAVETRDAFSNLALDAQIRRRMLAPRDAGLASAIAYGVLKNRNWLDATLNRWLKKPLAQLDPFSRAVFRSAAYQILCLDRVPDHAVVHESVKIVKSRARHRAGLVNAVLRRLVENADALKAERDVRPQNSGELAHRFGLPVWLSDVLVDRVGLDQAMAYGEAIQAAAPVTLRVRDPKHRTRVVEALTGGDRRVEATDHAPGGVRVWAGGDPTASRPVADGDAVIQDEASQLVSLFAAPEPGWRVLDLCAGRGGKTMHLSDLMGGSGQLVASDLSGKKLETLMHTARALGIDHIETCPAEARGDLAPADLVLLDCPCSGTGVMRRHPEIRWRSTPERLRELVATQRELLTVGAKLVKPGGLLVYAVCSDLPAEGVAQIEWFLREVPGWHRDPPTGEMWEGVMTADRDLLTQPHLHDADGFFCARLRRR